MTVSSAAFAQQFDPQTLKRLGISPEAAAYFSKTARFLPGVSRVRLVVNGTDLGTMDVRFSDEGTLCFTPELLQRAGLKVPDGTSEESCQDYRKAYPETAITQLPNQSQVDIVTPLARARPIEQSIQGQYASGGAAAMMNYNVSGSRSASGGSSYQYLRAYTETGVNIADWILRSRQDYYSQGGRSTFTQGDTYAQHAVPSVRSTFQAGQISPAGSLFSVGTLRGAQLFPEQALRQTLASGVNFSGIATGQSRIEVRQLGRLILMTQVPAGAFTINDVPIVSGNSDLEVQVIAASGERQQFVVPAASFGNVRNVAPQGLSAAVGRYQASRGSDSRTPLVATVSNGWSLGSRSTSTPAFWCPPRTAHWPPGFQSTPAMRSALRSACASSASFAGEKLQGQQITANLSATPVERLSTSLSATLQTEGYRDLAQVVQAPRPDARILPSASQTYTAGVSWFSRPWAPFPQPIPPAACPARKASATARRCPGTGASPAPRSACPWPGSQHGTRARSENQYFLTLSFPWAAPAPAPMSASQAIAAVLALLTPTPSARSSATASARASPGPTARSIRRHRSTRCRATRASTCPPTGVRKAACRRTGGAGLGGGRGWRGGVLAL